MIKDQVQTSPFPTLISADFLVIYIQFKFLILQDIVIFYLHHLMNSFKLKLWFTSLRVILNVRKYEIRLKIFEKQI